LEHWNSVGHSNLSSEELEQITQKIYSTVQRIQEGYYTASEFEVMIRPSEVQKVMAGIVRYKEAWLKNIQACENRIHLSNQNNQGVQGMRRCMRSFLLPN
jgi:hypothetical protein